jgi:predicted signal transduction protein with EAL and GGDEF domain
LVIGASVGIALSPGDGATSEELMRNADMALYRAKSDGGGVHHFFEKEMDLQAQRRRDMELDLRRAFANGEFELHYQPLVSIASNRISGFESLLRWRHPDKGMISPAEFIPVAEDIGLITQLGEWVLREACSEAVKWPRDIKVAVNLSPAQFRSRNLVQVVISALAQSGLSPKRLELEITESIFLAETDANLATLHQLRELGVGISMDDFGTGYSSLAICAASPSTRSRSTALSSRISHSAPTASRSCARSPGSAAASTSPRQRKASRPRISLTGCAPKAATRFRDSCSAQRVLQARSRNCWSSSASAPHGRRRSGG